MYFKNPSQSEMEVNKKINKKVRQIKQFISNGMSKDEAVQIAKSESTFTNQVWEYILNEI